MIRCEHFVQPLLFVMLWMMWNQEKPSLKEVESHQKPPDSLYETPD
jgi:hypothetical protein